MTRTMNEIDLIGKLGSEVPPLSPAARERVHERMLARAGVIDSRAGLDGRPARRPMPRRRRAILLTLTGVTAAATAAVLPLALSTPAYAVSKRSDGTVTVEIREFLEPKKLQASLREAGVAAVVDYLPIGQSCQQPRGRSVATAQILMERPAKDSDGVLFQIAPGSLKSGQTLVVEATFDQNNPAKAGNIATSVVEGQATDCKVTRDPAAQNGDGSVKVVPVQPGKDMPGVPAGS